MMTAATLRVRALCALVLASLLAFGLVGTAAAQTVRVTVNDQSITDVQISQRAQLFRLEGRGADTNAARTELVNEALMLQEAARLGISVSQAQVDSAFETVARNIRVSTNNLRQILTDNGVPVETLQARLRANIAWGQVAQRAVAPRIQLSDLELEQQAQAQITTTSSFDYILKEIRFLTTSGSASSRTAQANQYRSRFTGCDDAVALSLTYTDAAVIDLGRRHATQLPDAVAAELARLNVGGITSPRVVENGVSMLAVCQKAEARDTTFIKSDIAQEMGNAQMEAEAARYLEELRSRARIVFL